MLSRVHTVRYSCSQVAMFKEVRSNCAKYKLDDEAMGSTLFRNRGGFVVTTERSEVVT